MPHSAGLRLSEIPFGAAVALAALAAFGASPRPARAAGLLVPSGSPGAPLEIVSHRVGVEIDNGIARTRVEQVFRNRRPEALEAVYRFPVPADATISHLSLWIGGRELTGEVVERARARAVYEEITQSKRDPALLEQASYKLFECRVFPVPGNGEQRVAIEYLQPVELDAGIATYTYPLETRAATGSLVTGELSVTVDLLSEVPLAGVECPSHGERLAAVRIAAGHYRFSHEERGASLDEDLVIRYALEAGETGIDVVADAPADDDGTFLLTLTPGDDIEASVAPLDFIFLLDVSGSMSYEGRIDIAHRALKAFIEGMRPVDRFQVILFNIAPQPLFEKVLPPTDEALGGALRAVAARKPGGGTDLFPALQMALGERTAGRPAAIVLISDGQSNEGTEEHARFVELLRREGGGVRIFTFGVGNEVNRPLLARLAEGTGGLADVVSSTDDIEARAEALRDKVERPVVSDIEIAVEGVEAADIVPAGPYRIFAGGQLRVHGRFKKGGGPARIVASGAVAGEPRTFERAVSLPGPGAGVRRPELARMWAWKTTDALAQKARLEGESEAIRARGVALGVRYGVVGPWTSFLVLESEQQYAQFGIERKNAARREVEEAARRDRRAAAADAARTASSYPTSVPVASTPPADRRPPRPAPEPERPSGVGGGRRSSGGRSWGGGGGGSSGLGLVALLAGAGLVARRLAKRRPLPSRQRTPEK